METNTPYISPEEVWNNILVPYEFSKCSTCEHSKETPRNTLDKMRSQCKIVKKPKESRYIKGQHPLNCDAYKPHNKETTNAAVAWQNILTEFENSQCYSCKHNTITHSYRNGKEELRTYCSKVTKPKSSTYILSNTHPVKCDIYKPRE